MGLPWRAATSYGQSVRWPPALPNGRNSRTYNSSVYYVTLNPRSTTGRYPGSGMTWRTFGSGSTQTPILPAMSEHTAARMLTLRSCGGPNTRALQSCSARRQTAVAHSAPEAETAAADEALRRELLPALPLWETLLDRPHMAEFVEDNQAVVKVCKAGGGRRNSCTFPELAALRLLP